MYNSYGIYNSLESLKQQNNIGISHYKMLSNLQLDDSRIYKQCCKQIITHY